MTPKWKTFWDRVLSPHTARFILAILSLAATVGATAYIMGYGLKASVENAVMFALGQLFALASGAFSYYFGSTARGDDRAIDAHIVNPAKDPVPVTPIEEGPDGKPA